MLEPKAAEEVVPTATWFEASDPSVPPRPLIKMPGSKRWLARALRSGADSFLKQGEGTLYEPFAGSAVVAMTAGALGHKLVVSDASFELVSVLVAARDCPDVLFEKLSAYVDAGVSKARYLDVRSRRPTDLKDVAAWTLYLARLAFNGLWRVNARGQFNVPYGQSLTRAFPSRAAIRAVGTALSRAEVFHADFRAVMDKVAAGDLVYLDPPYIGTFTSFEAGGWRTTDVADLAACARAAAERGAAVIVSSPSDAETAEPYRDWAYRTTVPQRHKVAARAKDRKAYPEAIYTNRPDLIDLAMLTHSTKKETTDGETRADGEVPEGNAATG